jgi:hypothetical protein
MHALRAPSLLLLAGKRLALPLVQPTFSLVES